MSFHGSTMCFLNVFLTDANVFKYVKLVKKACTKKQIYYFIIALDILILTFRLSPFTVFLIQVIYFITSLESRNYGFGRRITISHQNSQTSKEIEVDMTIFLD